MRRRRRIPEELTNLDFENLIIEIGEDDNPKKFYAIYVIDSGQTQLERAISQQQYNQVEEIWDRTIVALLIQNGNAWVVMEERDTTEWLSL